MDDLPTQIFEAIRDHHTTFGSTVSSRVPLCLPPHAPDPELYALGISRFAEIFFAFESAWLSQLRRTSLTDLSNYHTEGDVDSFINDDAGRIGKMLSEIFIPELLRSERLRADLLNLESVVEAEKEEDSHAMKENAATAFASHIRDSTEHRPHLILVYAWIMYMALLNGGRRIRTKLVSAGPYFWEPKNHDGTLQTPPATSDGRPPPPNGLSFWFFDYDSNDQGIKYAFRERILSASSLLTSTERTEVIAEAVEIFHQCNLIVAEIDVEIARTAHHRRKAQRKASSSRILSSLKANLPPTSLGSRVRPILVGVAGLLGGLCAWLWAINAEVVQGYGLWSSRSNETDGQGYY
ncbi:hypothetical protein AJ80_08520 [Polytolypa hystricis UAMH7299]|uniref:Heme oxygenase-like protein n=1 Tax=Polytolypa hystricis (strain UAMH7299) TaxID=1447883 RepID=A0A2B7X689_POLH7|nr:hypothetical protein AJ80_08520 [Polytolypa hystricis UAMH7299]